MFCHFIDGVTGVACRLIWYWDHLGMKGDAEYDRKWTLKLRWY